MAEDLSDPAERSNSPTAGNRLDSWKEIAAYLQRDVTTVRRWEKREGLPVYRHVHDKLGSVHAYQHEIDGWWQSRCRQLNGRDQDRDRGTPDESVTSQPVAGTGSASRLERLCWWVTTISLLVAAFATVLALVMASRLSERAPTAVQQYRFSISPPESWMFGALAVSADGRYIAFTAAGPEGTRLWVQPLDSTTARSLPGTEDAAFPFWSPDSRFVGFFAQGKLKRIAVTDGVPQTVCDAPAGRGGTWNREGVILFAPGREGSLFRVAASGGVPLSVTTVDRALHRGHLWPEFLPDGRHFVYLADSTGGNGHGLYVAALDEQAPRRLLTAQSSATYSEGYLLYASGRALVAHRFDATRMKLGNERITLAEEVVRQYSVDHKGDFSASLTGVLAYRHGDSRLNRLVWLKRGGEVLGIVGNDPGMYTEPTLSPDGTRAAVSVFSGDSHAISSDVWLFDLKNGGMSRFTFDAAADFEPVWSPDGTGIVFASDRSGILNLFRKSARGTGSEELLLESQAGKHPEAWSPDGRFLVYSSFDVETRFDLWTLSLDGAREVRPYLRTRFSEGQSQISPDGRWLAYGSEESGRLEVYVRAFPVPDRKWQISSAGGADPRWRRDGRELFYIAADGKLMAVPVETRGTFEAGVPQPLFDTQVRDLWQDARNHYDVSHDGNRFLVATPLEDVRSLPVTVVLNWSTRSRD